MTASAAITLDDVVRSARAIHGRGRVLAVEWQGRKCWMKQTGGSNDMNLLNRIHRYFSPVLPDILHSAYIEDQLVSLKSEAARLRHWNQMALPAPLLLAEGDDWFLTDDGGMTLIDKIRGPDMAAKAALLMPALEALLAVHQAGTAHGRPMIKDMAADAAGQITLLDLEEDTLAVMPLAAAQARDLWIFLASTTRHADHAVLERLVSRALSQSTAPTLAEMRKSLKLLLVFKKTLQWLGPERLGREITGAFQLASTLKTALERL